MTNRSTGSCPALTMADENASVTNALFNNGTFTIMNDVATGDCEPIKAVIARSSDDVVLNSKEVEINNI